MIIVAHAGSINGIISILTNQSFDKLVKNLQKDDFEIDEKDRNILLTNKGVDNIENIFSNAGILKNKNFYLYQKMIKPL